MNMYGTARGGGAAGDDPYGYTPQYGGIPNLPKYVTDTQTMTGTDKQAEMIKNLPGYQAMAGADTGNIQSNLAGKVAPDVLQLLQQQAAERGVGSGVGGAPNTDAAYLRALGLTSLQLQQLGHTQLTEAMQRTPFQERQTTASTHDTGLERAVYAAAPNPYAQAMEALRVAQLGVSAGNSGGQQRGGWWNQPTFGHSVGYGGAASQMTWD